jgi:hypothetical protein
MFLHYQVRRKPIYTPRRREMPSPPPIKRAQIFNFLKTFPKINNTPFPDIVAKTAVGVLILKMTVEATCI